MLAHSQLYQGVYDAAMKTSLTLTNYEDLLDPMEIYSLLGLKKGELVEIQCFLALTSYLAEYYGVCSKAFMKLETMPRISAEEHEVYANLAMQIFLK